MEREFQTGQIAHLARFPFVLLWVLIFVFKHVLSYSIKLNNRTRTASGDLRLKSPFYAYTDFWGRRTFSSSSSETKPNK